MSRGRLVAVLAMVAVASCGGQRSSAPVKARPTQPATPAPRWVVGERLEEGSLCGLGVAGAGFDLSSPYPKRLSRERAVRNLAGILGTRVQEAIIDQSTNLSGTQVESARVLTVDEALIERIDALAETDYWLDVEGTGPYAQKSFTYAHACVDTAKAAVSFKLDRAVLGRVAEASSEAPDDVPGWIDHTGRQTGGRLCAVGFSLPAFFADQTFERVVADVRGQLTEVIETMVSSYYEELTTNRAQFVEAMTLATTEAMARGVVVTHYWYDRDGAGPHGKRDTTYGWGCVYPVDVLNKSFAAVEAELPAEEQKTIAKVRQRATRAFEDLDAEIDKREAAGRQQQGGTVAEGQAGRPGSARANTDESPGRANAAATSPPTTRHPDARPSTSTGAAAPDAGSGSESASEPEPVPEQEPDSAAEEDDGAAARVAAGE